jgi:hypothetical protein
VLFRDDDDDGEDDELLLLLEEDDAGGEELGDMSPSSSCGAVSVMLKTTRSSRWASWMRPRASSRAPLAAWALSSRIECPATRALIELSAAAIRASG